MLEVFKAWTRAFINSLPDAAFAVIEPAYKAGTVQDKNCRHLPHHTSGVTNPNDDNTVDLPHLRNALARATQIQPVTDSITAEELRAKALAHLQAHAKRLGVGEAAEVQKVSVFKAQDAAKRIVYGEVYVPWEPDAHGNWMTPEDIEAMAHRWMAELKTRPIGPIDQQHNKQPVPVLPVESFVARPGDPTFTPGAWVLAVKVLDDQLWADIQAGLITGFSIDALVTINPVPTIADAIAQAEAARQAALVS